LSALVAVAVLIGVLGLSVVFAQAYLFFSFRLLYVNFSSVFPLALLPYLLFRALLFHSSNYLYYLAVFIFFFLCLVLCQYG
jgi:hypothetical protein